MTGIITQGARDFGHIQYVAAYKVAYGDDGVTWTEYKDPEARESKVSVCPAVLPSPLQGCPVSQILGSEGEEGWLWGPPDTSSASRFSLVTWTIIPTRRTCLRCRSRLASCASSPWPGTTVSPCVWSCWAVSGRPSRSDRKGPGAAAAFRGPAASSARSPDCS